MQTSTVAFGTIVTSNDQTVAVRVTITWPASVPVEYQVLNGDNAVVSCKPLRETQTDMPDTTRYFTGRAAASLTLKLAGLLDPTDDTKTLSWLMGQYSTGSPMFRQSALNLPVTVDMGILTGDATAITPPFEGVVFVRAFTGVIDDYTTHTDGSVDLTCIEAPRSKLFGSIQLPSAYAGVPGKALMSLVWPMRQILAAGGYYDNPQPRPSCLIYVSNHGGFWPELGATPVVTVPANADGSLPGFAAGKWCPQVVQPAPPSLGLATATAGIDLTLYVGLTLTGEVWVNVPATGGAGLSLARWGAQAEPVGASDMIQMDIQGDAAGGLQLTGLFRCGWTTASSGTDTPYASTVATVTAGQHLVTWSVTYIAEGSPRFDVIASIIFWVDGVQIQSVAVTITLPTTVLPGAAPALRQATTAFVGAGCALDTLQLTTEPSTAGPSGAFAPNVTLDPSLNNLTAIPDLAGADGWTALQDMASAELGVIGSDELGNVSFRNRRTLQTTPAVRVIDRESSLLSIDIETNKAALLNHIQVPVNKLQVSPPVTVWAAADTITVPKKGRFTQVITTDNPVVNLAAKDSGEMPSGGGTPGLTYWRACRDPGGAGPRVTTGVSVKCVQLGPTSIRVTVSNTNAFVIYLVSPIGVGFPPLSNGAPILWVGGQFVSPVTTSAEGGVDTGNGVTADAQYPPVIPDGGAVTNVDGETLLSLAGNVWRQDLDTSEAMADDLLVDLSTPRPQWTNVKIITDPRLQIGDRVTLNDPETSGIVNEDAIIANIEPDDDWTTSLDLRALRAPGTWMTDVLGSSEVADTVGTSTIWIV